ncbi:lytic transglycosylase domain-containing protein [Phaeobacter sp.]|uniref:lytic transglycosylase domain-containing protein n=1 Tax=Phaeobacter sp. TaxID=1902409 RepID=UPI0025F82CA1|nr:lytic transglycosylase domain-containing protein [Phaeobacter sp.]
MPVLTDCCVVLAQTFARIPAHIVTCLVIAAAFHAGDSAAQTTEQAPTAEPERSSPAPFPQFEAKRVRPPKAGAAKRITIQIDPEPAAPAASAVDADPLDPAAVVPATRYGGFWRQVSDRAEDTGPGRLQQALAALGGDVPVVAPRLQTLQDIAADFGIEILTASVGTDVSPALILAVIAVESGGDPEAISAAGAAGLMQLMPDTAARFEVKDSFNTADNIRGGVRYLNWLMGEFGQDPILVLAGYNAGEGAVRSHGGVPPFAETRDYVPKVLAAYRVARGLCMTPPELLSDGCVFRALN